MIRLKYIFLFTCLVYFIRYSVPAQAQSATNKFVDLNLGIGDSEGTLAFSFNYDWGLGLRKKLL